MIVSSVIAWKNIQIDGRSEVREIYTDDQGIEYIYDYMADPKMDIDGRLMARAKELNEKFSQDEKNAPILAQKKIDEIQDQINALQDDLAPLLAISKGEV